MKDDQDFIDSTAVSRRDLVRKGARAAYIVPVVMAAIKATERPAFAQFSCAPNEIEVPQQGEPICRVCPPGEMPAPDGVFCVPALQAPM